MKPGERIIRIEAVVERIGLCASQIYALAASGEFPRQIKLSARASGWVESEIDEWIARRIIMSRNLRKKL